MVGTLSTCKEPLRNIKESHVKKQQSVNFPCVCSFLHMQGYLIVVYMWEHGHVSPSDSPLSLSPSPSVIWYLSFWVLESSCLSKLVQFHSKLMGYKVCVLLRVWFNCCVTVFPLRCLHSFGPVHVRLQYGKPTTKLFPHNISTHKIYYSLCCSHPGWCHCCYKVLRFLIHY